MEEKLSHKTIFFSLLLHFLKKMASHIIVAAILIMGIFSTSSARDFSIGWVQNPKESFDSFSSRMRFQVNDKLVFKYNKGEDSVLVVKKEDYDSCNVENPIQKLEGGDSSTFQLTRSGPFYFISGVQEKCSKGEKLALVVLSPKSKKPVPSSPTSMAPSVSPSSSSSSMAPSVSPSSSSTSSMVPNVSPSSSSMVPSVSPSSSTSTAPSISPPSPPSMAPSVSPSSPSSSSSMAPSVSPSSSSTSSMVPNVSPSSSSIVPSVSPSSSSSMAPSISSPPSMVPSISPAPSSSSSMAPSNSPSPSVSGSSITPAPGSSNGGGDEPVASPTSTTQIAKSSATASSVTIIIGVLGILGHAFLG